MSGINIYGDIYIKGNNYNINNGPYNEILTNLSKMGREPVEEDTEKLILVIEKNNDAIYDLITEIANINDKLSEDLKKYFEHDKKGGKISNIISKTSDYITIGQAAMGLAETHPVFTQQIFEIFKMLINR